MFCDDPFIQMLITLSENNEVKILTIPHLKNHVQMELNTFNKHLQQELNDHCAEAKVSQFFQFIDDSHTLKNKHEYQTFSMQFSNRTFRRNNVIALLIRKVLSRKSENVSGLVEEARTEVTGNCLKKHSPRRCKIKHRRRSCNN